MKETEDKLLQFYFLMLMSIIPAADWFMKAPRMQSPQSAREAFERIKRKRPSDEPTPEVVTHGDTQNPDSLHTFQTESPLRRRRSPAFLIS